MAGIYLIKSAIRGHCVKTMKGEMFIFAYNSAYFVLKIGSVQYSESVVCYFPLQTHPD